MRPEEIALRMRGVTGLQTVVASRIARQLSQMGCELAARCVNWD